MDWHIPLVIAAVAFVGFFVWRLRPVLSSGERVGPKLREARARIAAAKTDEERATALCDAGDLCARGVGRTRNAIAYYLRAMRAAPDSVEIVERAAAALAKRPRALEALAWRRLGSEGWEGDGRAASVAMLGALASPYGKMPKHHVRARALEQALAAMGAPPRAVRPRSSSRPS